DVLVIIEGTNLSTKTDILGEFELSSNLPLSEQCLNISKEGYVITRYPIPINAFETVNITVMIMDMDDTVLQDLFTITLSEDELDTDDSGLGNISGLLQSSLDVFQRTAAFEFSPSFFRVRGLNTENSSLLINGLEMNKIYN